MFRFYILFLLGFMSGIAAGTGSRFMNGKTLGAKLMVPVRRALFHFSRIEKEPVQALAPHALIPA